ncbi:MAG: hypothetical protein RJA44_1326 [Pseudomonadota bacterium]
MQVAAKVNSPLSISPVALTGASRFQTAMSTRPCARSPHFMLHHGAAAQASLSTDSTESVDKLCTTPAGHYLGMVVPKRHAKRSVTRSLIRRQLREGLRRHVDALPPGDLVLRLRAPIDRQTYPSAASDALATLLRQEIETLLRDAVRRLNRPAASAAS